MPDDKEIEEAIYALDQVSESTRLSGSDYSNIRLARQTLENAALEARLARRNHLCHLCGRELPAIRSDE